MLDVCGMTTALDKLMEEQPIKGHYIKKKSLLAQKVPEHKLAGAESVTGKYHCIHTFS